MIVGLLTSNVSEGLVFALGTYNLSVAEAKRPDSLKAVRILFVASIVNALALALGTIVGLTGWSGVPLFGIGFFVTSFVAIYADAAILGLVAAILFSVGVGLPGGGTVVAAGDRLAFCLLGGLWGLLGVIVAIAIKSRTSLKLARIAKIPSSSYLQEQLKPLAVGLSLGSARFRFSLVFGLAGAFGLLIALYLGVSRDYWVLLTLAILLLRSDIATTVRFAISRIIGTIVGAVLGVGVLISFSNPWVLLPFLFVFCALYFATRNINFGLGAVFITPFVLILVSIPNPGHPLIAETRILDTFIGAALALLTVSLLWISSRLKRS